MHRRIAFVATLFLLLAGWSLPAAGQNNEEIVASLHRLKGAVQVTQAESGETVSGREGLLLRHGDTVQTDANANATIKFRDGSEVRLFQNTQFTVESQEQRGQERTFARKLYLKLGSFWGRFIKQRQTAQVETPTATIGIKGTSLRVTETGGTARVALTEGAIDVTNERETVSLQPGKRITDFGPNDSIQDKVQDIPYKLEITSERRELAFPGRQPQEVFLSVQLVDVNTGRTVARPGPLYLRSNYDRIGYPPEASLNERGFARVPLTIQPPEPADARLNGSVYVWALLDQAEADDTGEGRILFRIPVPDEQDRIRIDSDTGETRRVQ